MSDAIIKTDKVEYRYKSHIETKEGTLAVKGISLQIHKGEFIVVLGRNGSGKSTLARLMNALLLPTSGTVYIKGLNTKDEGLLWEIRRTAGMVFQNPDNQIIGTTVEEDVAFGPENLGVDPVKIRKRVDNALDTVGISEYMTHAPHLLSGGQKQRVAIAGILSMKPECIILDEATAMLDPVGRREILEVVRKLNKEEGITVVHITHHMDEAVEADKILVMVGGEIIIDGTPAQVFSDVVGMKAAGLDVPQVTELFYEMKQEGYALPEGILTVDEAFDCLKGMLENK